MRISNKKGFTLIELIVVLAILAVLAAIIVPTTFGAIDKAKEAADIANLDALNAAVRMQKIIDQAVPGTHTLVSEALTNASISVPAIQATGTYAGFGWDDGAKEFILVTPSTATVTTYTDASTVD